MFERLTLNAQLLTLKFVPSCYKLTLFHERKGGEDGVQAL